MAHKAIHRNAIVSYSCAEMYALVSDIPSYGHFLPYCISARILSSKGDIIHGEMVFSYFGLTYTVVTKNTMHPHRRIGMALLKGDMQTLDGQWLFDDLGDGRCRVSLDLSIDMHDGILYKIFNRIIDHVADTMVDRFVDRAYQIYGFGED